MNIYNNITEAKQVLNDLGGKGTPFLFLIDYEMSRIIVSTDLEHTSSIKFDINGKSNSNTQLSKIDQYYFEKYPISIEEYTKGFDLVSKEIKRGNSFLLNLAYPTRLMTNLTLDDIYGLTSAKYKILLEDQFVCYSPEIFVKINDGKISSNPMKGTIDADIPNAESIILKDEKEIAEHYTIVDLIRNDLSRVAKNVKVDQFRYVDKIQTTEKSLLQVSSKITGDLPENYCSQLGDILFELLPAGSISGAPKKKTLEIIQEAEGQERGYYTGICGIFDGRDLDSGVMIRFIEQRDNELYYRSGGGITSMSDVDVEYHEMIDKVYLPISSAVQISDIETSETNV